MDQPTNIHRILEFDISDLSTTQCRISLKEGVVNCSGERDSVVYTILQPRVVPVPDGTTVMLVPYDMQPVLDRLVWTLAGPFPGLSFWMLALFTGKDDMMELAKRRPLITPDGVRLLVEFERNDSLGLPSLIGAGHIGAFHLFAVPSQGETDMVFRTIWECPEYHRIIRKLIGDYNFTVTDSLFEVRPYGDEDRDHVEIVCSSHIPRSHVQKVIRDTYQMPYCTIRLTASEFERWEDTSMLPRFVDLYPIG